MPSEAKREAAMKQSASSLIHLEKSSSELFGLVFDCDGVLFDSKEANTAYYNHIRFAVQMPPMTAEEASFSHMATTDEAIEKMIPDELLEEARLVRSRTKYRDTFMGMMQPALYMVEFLRNMREAGLPLALCTNRSDSVHEVLRHFGIEEYFSLIMTVTCVQPKPSPEGLLEIARIWGTPPETIAFLGDSLVDQQAAAAAGVPFWSYSNPMLAAEMHIPGFHELNDIMRLMLMRE